MAEASTNQAIENVFADLEPGPITNPLAERYASLPMRRIWSPEGKIVAERALWVAVMQAQSEVGIDIPQDHINDYIAVAQTVDLSSIKQRELRTKHDVKARIEEFNDLAGHQDIHRGMTSRDLTDNVEQLQVRLALELIRVRMIAGISRLAIAAATNIEFPVAARSHFIPAQVTTFGKRFANLGEELVDAYQNLEHHIDTYKLRGIKGPVGTQQDMLDLSGDSEKVAQIETSVARALGFSCVYGSVGQIYPRSRDFETAHQLTQSVAPLSNFARWIRLASGTETMAETTEKRDGSSAMPHKVNPRTSERINSTYTVARGFESMLGEIAGDQWLEGSVADSVVRRVALEGGFYAADGAYQSFLTVMDEFKIYKGSVEAELRRNMPFLMSTKLLMAAVKAGMGREDAHAVIKQHAFAAIEYVREAGGAEYDLYDRLAADPDFPLSLEQIEQTIDEPLELVGNAVQQTKDFLETAAKITNQHPDAANYQPEPLL